MKILEDIELGKLDDVRVTAFNVVDLWLDMDAAEAVEVDDLCLRSSYHEIRN